MEFIKDIWGYLKTRKKWWLVPCLVFLLLLGVLVFTTSGTVVAPFVYTLF